MLGLAGRVSSDPEANESEVARLASARTHKEDFRFML